MKGIADLEYRLNDERNGYPAIYYYHQLDRSEIFCRRICDYFIKDGKVFRKSSCSREKEMVVIYVEEDLEEELFDHAPQYSYVTLEIRLYLEEKDSPLIHTYGLETHDDALEWIGNDNIQIGEDEYEKVSAEIDEDRSTYVLYVDKTRYKFK